MLLQIVAKLLLLFAHLDQLLVAQVGVTDRSAGAHGPGTDRQLCMLVPLVLVLRRRGGIAHGNLACAQHRATTERQVLVRARRLQLGGTICVPRLCLEQGYLTSTIIDLKLMLRVLLLYVVHPCRFHASSDVIALVTFVVHGVLR